MFSQKSLKPYHGILALLLVIAFFIFCGFPLQQSFGLYGLALTELGILAIACIAMALFKLSIKEVLPIKKPRFKQIAGVVCLWLASYSLVLIANVIVMCFSPELIKLSTALNELFTSESGFVSFFIVALMPAICEEVLHRGFILTSFKTIKRQWVFILCMSLIFGCFHLDPYRFLGTAILGGSMTYIMLKTENIIMPMLYHFINNFVTTSIAFIVTSIAPEGIDATAASTSTLSSLGGVLFMATFAPLLLILGVRLLSPPPTKNLWPRRIAAIVSSLVLFLSGVTLVIVDDPSAIFANLPSVGTVFEETIDAKINEEPKPFTYEFTVEQPGNYNIDIELATEKGLGKTTILDARGKKVLNMSGSEYTCQSEPTPLMPGTYTVIISFRICDNPEEYANFADISSVNADNYAEALRNYKPLIVKEPLTEPVEASFSIHVYN